MKFQYASDLHLEFPDNRGYLRVNPLQPVGEVLLLAGDIVPFALIDMYQDFFSYVSDHFATTYWLPGNHEYYGFDISEKGGVLHEKICSNVFLVNNTSVVHGNAKLIFTTLWGKISQENRWMIEKSLNDFHQIRYNGHRLSSEYYNQLHDESILFLTKAFEEAEKAAKEATKVAAAEEAEGFLSGQSNGIKEAAEKALSFPACNIVVTHHVPTLLNYPAAYKGDSLNEAFATELFDLIENSPVNYWIYGHHHSNVPEFQIGRTKMLTNQLGYLQRREHLDFRKMAIIET